jgi:hypothetical protein
MSPLVTPKGLKIIGVITLIGIVAVVIYKHFVPYTSDHEAVGNYVAAEQHILILRLLIEKDHRFSKVSLSPFTGQGGCLSVRGEVGSDSDMLALKRIVESSAPPVAVYYQVITPSNDFIFTRQPGTLRTNETAGPLAP